VYVCTDLSYPCAIENKHSISEYFETQDFIDKQLCEPATLPSCSSLFSVLCAFVLNGTSSLLFLELLWTNYTGIVAVLDWPESGTYSLQSLPIPSHSQANLIN
jgi:hypothetical protein